MLPCKHHSQNLWSSSANHIHSPPRTWFLPNFLVLFFTALMPFFWWTTVFTVYTTLWQDVWGWSAISMAIHM